MRMEGRCSLDEEGSLGVVRKDNTHLKNFTEGEEMEMTSASVSSLMITQYMTICRAETVHPH